VVWTGKEREFRQTGREHTIVWKIGVVGATDTTTWGKLNGKLQRVSNTYEGVNIGKSNEVSPRENALLRAERKILMKTREGFLEFRDGKQIGERGKGIHPEQPLPENLCFYKPSNSLGAGLKKKARQGEVLFTRKRDGAMFVARITDDDVEFYSRTMQRGMHTEDRPWSERFSHLYEEFMGMLVAGKIPPNSIILGELVADHGRDNLSHVQSVLKSSTEESILRQERGGRLFFYAWDVAQWGGEMTLTEKIGGDRHTIIEEAFQGTQWIIPIDIWDFEGIWEEGVGAVLNANPEWVFRKQKSDFPYKAVFTHGSTDYEFLLDDLAMQLSLSLGWEGWVIVDPTVHLGDKAVNFRGKPDRPSKVTGKLKPVHEDDFIVEWDPDSGVGTYGTGKNQKRAGSLALYQLNSKQDMVWVSDVGGGIKDKHSKDYPAGLLRVDLSDVTIYPLVASVAYTSRTYKTDGDKTNALTFPRILRFRTDKDPGECVNPKL